MKSLNEALTLRQQALKPRSKFSFKSRDKKPVQEKVQEQKQEEKREELASSVSQNGATIRGFQKQRFRLEQPTTGTDTALDVLIDHCEDCIIDLTDGALTIAALHLSKLRRCLILCRPIQGSALIEDCQHCTFFFACHQVITAWMRTPLLWIVSDAYVVTRGLFFVHIQSPDYWRLWCDPIWWVWLIVVWW